MEVRSRLRHRELRGYLKKGETSWCHQQPGCLSVKELSVWTWEGSSSWFKSWIKNFCYSGRAVESLLCPCLGGRSSSSLPGSHLAHVLLLRWDETWPGISPCHSLISMGSKSPDCWFIKPKLLVHQAPWLFPSLDVICTHPGKDVVSKHSPDELGKLPVGARMDRREGTPISR